MEMPRQKNGRLQPWVTKRENEALLYFVQLIHNMLFWGSPEHSRVVSLDTFHRLKEAARFEDENRNEKWFAGTFNTMLKEIEVPTLLAIR